MISDWLSRVKARLDDKTGLIPHSVDYEDGTPLEGARGCSQSLMNIILPDIDTTFAKEQYALYKQQFVSSLLGLPIVREYPKGTFGTGDIDSGPVIFGVGGAAMVVGVGALTKFDVKAISTAMRQTIEAFGVPVTLFGKKRYVFGSVIVGDAFLLWSELQKPVHLDVEREAVSYWRLKFHLYSLLVFAVLCVPLALARVSRA